MASDDIVLYFWPTPNGQKISIMLEEIGEPYEVRYVDIGAGAQFEPAFLAISPNNKIPAIVDPDGPDGKPLSLFESGAILQYLARKFEMLYPTSERRKADIDQWLFWQVGGLGPMAGQAMHFRKYAPEKIDYAIERYTQEVGRLLTVMDTRLGDRDYLAIEYSIADIACFPWINRIGDAGQDLSRYPRLAQWHARIAERPAVVRGLSLRPEKKQRSTAAS